MNADEEQTQIVYNFLNKKLFVKSLQFENKARKVREVRKVRKRKFGNC